MGRITTFATIALFSLNNIACTKSSQETGTSGQAKVAFTKVAGQFTDRVSTTSNSCQSGNTCPSVTEIAKFEVKLINVGISTEQDTTTGYSSAIYMNAGCPLVKLQTEIDKKFYEYIGFGTCTDSDVTTYLDLRKSATEVNTDLNSQLLPIAPGSYKYGFISLCQGGASTNNFKITFTSSAGLPAELQGQTVEFALSSCGIQSPEMSPAMEVTAGQSVTVAFEYDLENTIYYRALSSGESASTNCVEVGTGTRYAVCLQAPVISASFSAAN